MHKQSALQHNIEAAQDHGCNLAAHTWICLIMRQVVTVNDDVLRHWDATLLQERSVMQSHLNACLVLYKLLKLAATLKGAP